MNPEARGVQLVTEVPGEGPANEDDGCAFLSQVGRQGKATGHMPRPNPKGRVCTYRYLHSGCLALIPALGFRQAVGGINDFASPRSPSCRSPTERISKMRAEGPGIQSWGGSGIDSKCSPGR